MRLKQGSLVLIFLLSFASLKAQKVTNVRAEQNGNKLEIYYQIEKSKSNEIYSVSAYYENEKGVRTKLRSVNGDVGKNVVGGKNQYLIIWDVLKDVDELGTAEFIVKIEKKSESIQSAKQGANWMVAFNSGTGFTPYGFRIGYGNDWDVFFAARFGSDGFVQDGDQITETALNSFNLGLGRTVYSGDKSKIKLYVAGGLANWGNYKSRTTFTLPGTEENQYQSYSGSKIRAGNADKGVELEYGFYWIRNSLQLGFGLTNNLGENQNHSDAVIQLGFRF